MLKVLIDCGGEGCVDDAQSGAHLERARAQLEAWGFASFLPVTGRPGQYRYRVTPVGRAAHRWSWAAVYEGGAAGAIPGYRSPRRRRGGAA